MITAIVLINAERTKIKQAALQLATIEGITEVYSVSGRFDIVAIIRLANNDDLADLMTEKITLVDGITKTESMVAFNVLSKHDIASMFQLGD
ncbi:MAG TPA: Lrp/AsnC ligand binding domain-containing protein [Bacteroidales bacterium]|nr:Lrp/AsnC ligand binding domain-containing protein [Bacteroidales bacterium]